MNAIDSPEYQGINPAPTTVGWLSPQDLSNDFVDPSFYPTPDIICHVGAIWTDQGTPQRQWIVEFQWTEWAVSSWTNDH